MQEFQIINILDPHIQRCNHKPIRAFLKREFFRNDFLIKQFIELESKFEFRLDTFSYQFNLEFTFIVVH